MNGMKYYLGALVGRGGERTPRGVASRWAAAVALLGTLIVATDDVGASSSTSSAPRSAPTMGVYKAAPATEAAASEYWTKERLASAQPMVANRSGGPQKGPDGTTTTVGTPGAAGGYAPPTEDEGGGAPIATSSSGSPEAVDGSFPGPHSTWEWFGKYRVYPMSTIGKLFFTKATGGNFSCSASVTWGGKAEWKDIVFTAGHCVSDGAGNFHNNLLFCPSYDNGVNAAVGCWGYTGRATTSAWHNNGAWSRDFGVVFVKNCGTVHCKPIVDVTASLGFAWNQARDQHWMDFGYPGNPAPYNGNKIIVSATEHRYNDTTDSFGPANNSYGTRMAHGASGGPLLLNFNKFTAPYINSVNSYVYGTQVGQHLQGPYFDTTACNHWKAWTGWAGTC